MSSKVNGVNSTPLPAVNAGRAAKTSGSAGAVPGSADSASGNVHITGAASQLANLEQAVRNQPAINESRVASLRSAIEQGTYTISATAVADGLIRSERLLSNLKSGR